MKNYIVKCKGHKYTLSSEIIACCSLSCCHQTETGVVMLGGYNYDYL